MSNSNDSAEKKDVKLPGVAIVLETTLPKTVSHSIISDITELYYEQKNRYGRRWANFWLVKQVICSISDYYWGKFLDSSIKRWIVNAVGTIVTSRIIQAIYKFIAGSNQ